MNAHLTATHAPAPAPSRSSSPVAATTTEDVRPEWLHKRGAMRGIRLISYDSLMRYLAGLG